MSTARPRRYVVDVSWQRHDDTVIAGSPLRVFRLTPSGVRLADAVERGTDVSTASAGVRALLDRWADAGAIHPVASATDRHRHGVDDVTVVTPIHRVGDAGPPPGSDLGVARILVDDASDPPVPGARIRLDHNLGPGGARNAGASVVTTPLIAFVDDDVDLPDTWLAPLLAHFDDERVGLVAPRVRSAPGSGRLERYERAHSPLDLGPVPARIRAGTRVSYVPAAAVVVRADALEAVGGYDPTLRFGEDVDLVWRLDAAGWICRYEPAAVVRHAPRPTWSAWARQRIGYASSTAPLARRHPGALAPVRMNRWSAIAWLAALAWPTAGIAIATTAAAALVPKLSMLPRRVAFGLAMHGTWRAGDQLANAVRRVWWPVLVLVALRSRLARRALVLSWVAARGPIRALDDLCASVGMWRGVIRERSATALAPRLDRWPPAPTTRGTVTP